MGLLSRHAFFVTLALVVSAFSAGQVHAQSIIGTTAVARGTITAQKIDGSVHALAIGTPLHQNDTIQTGTDGIVELLFIDQTVMTLGPNSHLRLDELVFQPNAGGKFLSTLTTGVARFFSGVQPKSAYAVQTPTATIGIRGTIFDVLVDKDRATTVILRRGIVALRNQSGVVRTIRTPNLASTARRINEAPSKAARPDRSSEQRAQRLNELTPARVSTFTARKFQATRATPPSRGNSPRLKRPPISRKPIARATNVTAYKARVLRSKFRKSLLKR